MESGTYKSYLLLDISLLSKAQIISLQILHIPALITDFYKFLRVADKQFVKCVLWKREPYCIKCRDVSGGKNSSHELLVRVVRCKRDYRPPPSFQ